MSHHHSGLLWTVLTKVCIQMTDLSPAVVVVLVFYFVQDRRDDEQGQETTEKSNQVVDLRVPRKLSQHKF